MEVEDRRWVGQFALTVEEGHRIDAYFKQAQEQHWTLKKTLLQINRDPVMHRWMTKTVIRKRAQKQNIVFSEHEEPIETKQPNVIISDHVLHEQLNELFSKDEIKFINWVIQVFSKNGFKLDDTVEYFRNSSKLKNQITRELVIYKCKKLHVKLEGM